MVAVEDIYPDTEVPGVIFPAYSAERTMWVQTDEEISVTFPCHSQVWWSSHSPKLDQRPEQLPTYTPWINYGVNFSTKQAFDVTLHLSIVISGSSTVNGLSHNSNRYNPAGVGAVGPALGVWPGINTELFTLLKLHLENWKKLPSVSARKLPRNPENTEPRSLNESIARLKWVITATFARGFRKY